MNNLTNLLKVKKPVSRRLFLNWLFLTDVIIKWCLYFSIFICWVLCCVSTNNLFTLSCTTHPLSRDQWTIVIKHLLTSLVNDPLQVMEAGQIYTNDHTVGWQNLNLLSATLALQARQARASGENLNYVTLAPQARPSGSILNYLLSRKSDIPV